MTGSVGATGATGATGFVGSFGSSGFVGLTGIIGTPLALMSELKANQGVARRTEPNSNSISGLVT